MESTLPRSPLIVVVDDDPWVLRFLADHFDLHGLVCRCHLTAESYLMSADVANTGCLVLDANLPGMDGLELQRRLVEDRHSFPIIFHTGQVDPRIEARAREAGAVDYLEKAAFPSQLIDAITHALATSPG